MPMKARNMIAGLVPACQIFRGNLSLQHEEQLDISRQSRQTCFSFIVSSGFFTFRDARPYSNDYDGWASIAYTLRLRCR